MDAFKFQVNLGGIIELLSDHLYGSPEVYIRELLQNAVDAITARRAIEAKHEGRVHIDVRNSADGGPRVLAIHDDGVGLTEEDVHKVLAMIGASSKRVVRDSASDFIGQFGIGLLSCFVVSEEIVVVTRATGMLAVEWRGRVDGTYHVTILSDSEAADVMPHVGTRVVLRAKKGAEGLFDPDRVVELARRFGGLLPYPIEVTADDERTPINDVPPPFRMTFANEVERRRVFLAYGRATFGDEFVDAIPMRSKAGGIEGIAYVLPYTTNAAAKRADRVYLKNMLLSSSAEQLLPSWSFFVRCIFNARSLRPNAARDAFYEDAALAKVRDALGTTLRDYLRDLSGRDDDTLHRIIALHGLALKELCLEDEALYRAVADFFPFESTRGTVTLGELRAAEKTIRYAPSIDGYRQIAHVASAEGLTVVNAGYVHDAAILARLPGIFPETRVEVISAGALSRQLADVTLDELESAASFLRVADAVLLPFRCTAEIKHFAPASIAVLYTASPLAVFRKSAKRTSEITGGAWGAVLDRLVERGDVTEAYAKLTFNFDSAIVQRLVRRANERDLLKHAIRALYTQSLMLGYHPLEARDMAAMNESLIGLVELATATSRKPPRLDS